MQPHPRTRTLLLALALCLTALACVTPPVEQPAAGAFLIATLRFES